MTTLQNALKVVNVDRGMTNYQKIHRWLLDHPNRTNEEMSAGLGIALPTTRAVTFEMLRRGMLTRQRSSRQGKGVNEYAARYREYELLPLKAERPPRIRTPKPDKAAPRRPGDCSVVAGEVCIENMSIAEARALYAQLHKIFGGG